MTISAVETCIQRGNAHTKERCAHVNRLSITYETFGQPEAPALLLIAGLAGQLINWPERFCTSLATRGYRVIRFDNRDVGLSTSFENTGIPDVSSLNRALESGEEVTVPYTLRDMAADAVGLLDALEIPAAHVVGSSMGGRIGQLMALEYPDRLTTLTCIGSTMGEPGFPPPNPEALRLLLMPAPRYREPYVEYCLKVTRTLSGSRFPIDESRVRTRAEIAYDRRFNPSGVTRHYAALIATASAKRQLKKLTVPSLIIHGGEDPLIPVECAHDMAQTIPGATLVVIDGMGHSLADTPAVWPSIIEAIDRHTQSGRNGRQPYPRKKE